MSLQERRRNRVSEKRKVNGCYGGNFEKSKLKLGPSACKAFAGQLPRNFSLWCRGTRRGACGGFRAVVGGLWRPRHCRRTGFGVFLSWRRQRRAEACSRFVMCRFARPGNRSLPPSLTLPRLLWCSFAGETNRAKACRGISFFDSPEKRTRAECLQQAYWKKVQGQVLWTHPREPDSGCR